MQRWLPTAGSNPHIHTGWKSGKIIHNFKNVEKWKTALSENAIDNLCGKLDFAQNHIPNKCELFYNSFHTKGDCYE